MARPLELEIQESQAELKKLLGNQKTAQGKERVQALYLLKCGQVTSVTNLAMCLGRHRVTVQKWLALYRRGGMTALLKSTPPSGRKPSIPQWAVEALKKRLAQPEGFGSYYAVQQWLTDTLDVTASYGAVYRLVRGKLKAKLKVAKRQSPEQDPEQLRRFKTHLGPDLSLLKGFVEERSGQTALNIRFWCQDETRWCLTTICRRLITAMGVKPVAPFQWQREGYWLYGLVEPLSGESFFYEFSHLDRVCFEKSLELFSQTYPDDWHIIQMDRASAHTAKKLVVPHNIILLFQPSHSPELNPIERLWEHLKDAFPWQVFESVEQLRQKVRELLEELTKDVVQSLTGWEYLLDALFVAGIS